MAVEPTIKLKTIILKIDVIGGTENDLSVTGNGHTPSEFIPIAGSGSVIGYLRAYTYGPGYVFQGTYYAAELGDITIKNLDCSKRIASITWDLDNAVGYQDLISGGASNSDTEFRAYTSDHGQMYGPSYRSRLVEGDIAGNRYGGAGTCTMTVTVYLRPRSKTTVRAEVAADDPAYGVADAYMYVRTRVSSLGIDSVTETRGGVNLSSGSAIWGPTFSEVFTETGDPIGFFCLGGESGTTSSRVNTVAAVAVLRKKHLPEDDYVNPGVGDGEDGEDVSDRFEFSHWTYGNDNRSLSTDSWYYVSEAVSGTTVGSGREPFDLSTETVVLYAHFRKKEDDKCRVKVTTSSEPETGGTTTGDGEYEDGAEYTIEATAASGYRFKFWTGPGYSDAGMELYDNPAVCIAKCEDGDADWTAHFEGLEPGILYSPRNDGRILCKSDGGILAIFESEKG